MLCVTVVNSIEWHHEAMKSCDPSKMFISGDTSSSIQSVLQMSISIIYTNLDHVWFISINWLNLKAILKILIQLILKKKQLYTIRKTINYFTFPNTDTLAIYKAGKNYILKSLNYVRSNYFNSLSKPLSTNFNKFQNFCSVKRIIFGFLKYGKLFTVLHYVLISVSAASEVSNRDTNSIYWGK